MGMTQQDRTEIREMIHGILSGWQAATIAREEVTNTNLQEIRDHLKKINGHVADNVKDIQELKLREGLHISECPAMPKIEELEKEIIGPWIHKHWKLAVILAILSLFIAYSMFELFSIKEIISFLK
jgi:hypothetical protein